MNKLDIILIVPLIWGLYRGFVKGFILQLAGIAAFILGVLGAIHFSAFIAQFLGPKLGWQNGSLQMLSFVIVFLGILVAVFFLARIMEKAVKMAALGIPNKIAGALFGALKFVLITGTVLYILNGIQNRFELIPSKTQEQSILYKYYLEGIKWVVPAMKKIHD